MLILSDEEVERLLPMSICIEAMEMTFREFAQGLASGRPRQRYVCPTPTEGAMYWANVHCGAVLGAGVAAVRVDTNLRTDKIGVDPRMTYRKSRPVNWGQVYLYSLETSEPLCIMPDRALSGVRVGATSALGARYLARQDARVLGLFGTGDQSRSNLEGVLQTVPSIKEVRVYSPDVSHRKIFVQEMSQRLGMRLTAVGSAREVVEGTDIVLCTTNSSRPLFPGDWLKPGQLVITIVNSDTVAQRTEVDEATFVRSDLIVINDRESVYGNNQRELLDPIDQGKFGWDKVRQLGDLVTGAHPGRQRADEIVYYKNNSGLGIQFAGAGGVVYRRALEQKVGREIPTEWFATDLSQEYARGFYH